MKRLSILVMATFCLGLPVTSAAVDIDIDKVLVRDMPREKMVEKFGRIPGGEIRAADLVDLAGYHFTGDTLRMLAILVEWENRLGTYSQQTMDSMIFSHNAWSTGSVADYIDEVSYGQVAMEGDVIDWYDAGRYTRNWGSGDFIALLYALDPVIDYSQYDGDGDGNVDAVCFIRSGNGEEDSGDPDDIWSYAMSWPGYGWGPFDGVMVTHWNTSPETRPLRNPENPTEFTGEDTLNVIRVFCHELSHSLGLPDLYDYDAKLDTVTYFTPNDYNDHPFVDWCLMGYGGYGIMSLKSKIPSHLCGWNKMQMEWIEPISLSGVYDDLVLYNIESTNDSSLYRIWITPSEGEYFLLEYRNPNSTGKFDKVDSDFSCYFWPDLTYGGDPLDRGLLISHVHDSLIDPLDDYRMNDGTPVFPHYAVYVKDAGYDPARDLTYNPEGRLTDSAQWWYPYETRRGALFSDDVGGQNEFGPNTVPNSDGHFGPTGIYVRVDSIVGDKMYIHVNTEGSVPCCQNRGDADGSGQVDILDIDFLVDYLYRGGDAPACEDEANVDASPQFDILDIDYFIDWLYRDGPPPVPCP
ncbi:MAG: M6 family metalloprotease domain-containing protein [Candidatus Zixiibacteriota bacterium]|nr:MAG: M6 family metalloprotease domain-containing protein [candidate division Zixibacteria bacterium]